MKHRPYLGGVIRELPDGRVQADYARNGPRIRRRFATDADARLWLETMSLDRTANIPAPTIPEIIDARDARALLPPHVSLRDAARFWADHHAVGTGGARRVWTRRVWGRSRSGMSWKSGPVWSGVILSRLRGLPWNQKRPKMRTMR